MDRIIKIKKGLKNNIIGSLLLWSSIAAITPIQASQQLFPPSDQERKEAREKRERAAEENRKQAQAMRQSFPPPNRRRREPNKQKTQPATGLTKEQWANMSPEKREKFKKENARRRAEHERQHRQQYNRTSGRPVGKP
jgi:hypothetical protein